MSNSSHPQTRKATHICNSENAHESFSGSVVTTGTISSAAGSLDDAKVVRETLLASIKKSGLSRAQIADRMTYLLGRKVTENMLHMFVAPSVQDRRWPAEFDRAFCEATGDLSLIEDRARAAGLIIIDAEQLELLELGRAYLAQKRAAETMARLERQLQGVQA